MSAFYARHYKIATKTADYQILEKDCGVIFNNAGAGGAVIFTLPNTATIQDGWNCRVFTMVLAQDVTVASYGSNDNIVTFNDIAADSIAFSTASERAGAGMLFVWDATNSKWMAFTSAEETQTMTVA